MESERTPLRSVTPAPSYVFMTNPNRGYRNKVRHFQCFVCAAFLAIFVTAVVITVSYSVNHDFEDKNGTTVDATTDQLMVLLAQTWPLPGEISPRWNDSTITAAELEAALEAGQEALHSREVLEAISPSLTVNSPSYRHQKAVGTTKESTILARGGFIMDIATKQLFASRKETPKKPVGRGPRLDVDWLPQEVCEEDLDEYTSCPPTPYRSVDGSCNNLRHPLQWGVAMRPFRRILLPHYADGVSDPRDASGGGDLPSARRVSLSVHRPLYRSDPKFTVMLAVWGQFIDHDITSTALSQKSNGSSISCCYGTQKSTLKMHPECFPVKLSAGDPYYHTYNLTCMEFVRSAPSPVCSLGPREQLNQATNFLDASVVYGSNAVIAGDLRRFVSGHLRMTLTEDGRTLLPISDDPNDGCNSEEMNAKGRYCFISGDARANENMHLTSMHLLWARQHNILASGLAQVNPTWDDERLYQEARRIVSSQMQHITYNEFLPILLGDELMNHLQLYPQKIGYFHGYNASIDPTVANSFASAAFRFAHTLLPGLMKVLSNDTSSKEYVELHKILFNPYQLYRPGYLDGMLRGVMDTGVLKVDPHLSQELSEHLFERPAPESTPPCGLDLVSLNIQRGRDHGLPGYPHWRQRCGFARPTSFADLHNIMDPESVNSMSTIYKSVSDIDMYTGMLAEMPVNGSFLGPTLTCLITDQFLRMKKGDRYWYETPEQPQAFTPALNANQSERSLKAELRENLVHDVRPILLGVLPVVVKGPAGCECYEEQLEEVRKTTLAKILCETSDSVNVIQRQVMRSVGSNNPRVLCKDLPQPDLMKWQEVDTSFIQSGITRIKMPSKKVHIIQSSKNVVEAASSSVVRGDLMYQKLALGATVISGRISTNSGRVWNGGLPIAIPLPIFDSIATITGSKDSRGTQSSAFGHGIVWDGVLTTTSSGYANLEGRFSMPKYIHGAGIANFSIQWLNGDFAFYTRLLWNSSLDVPLTITGTFSSSIHLKEKKQYEFLKDISTADTFNSFSDVNDFVSTPAIESMPGILKAPCVLLGTYSEDKKMFLWSGNVTMMLPNAAPLSSSTRLGYWSEDNTFVPLQHLLQLPANIPVKSSMSKKKGFVAIGAKVITGKVTVNSGRTSTVTWWNGTLPAAIPFPAFDKSILLSTLKGPAVPMFRSGLSWSGSVTFNSTGNATFVGNFCLPIFVHGPIANFSVEWWKGNFSFIFQQRWNMTLKNALQPGTTYYSPIFFRAAKNISNTETPTAEWESIEDTNVNPLIKFVTTTKKTLDSYVSVPIMLVGTYSPDKTIFWWSGNATVIVPAAPPVPDVQGMVLAMKKNGSQSKEQSSRILKKKATSVTLGASVYSGNVVASSGTSSPVTWWNGQLPVPIQAFPFDRNFSSPLVASMGEEVFAHGLSWQGSLTSVTFNEILLEGTFSMPRYVHGKVPNNFSIEWWHGQFSFDVRLLWNTTVDGLVLPGETYSSPIYFQGAAFTNKSDTSFFESEESFSSSRNIKEMIEFVAGSEEVTSSALRIPVILQGNFSADRSVFWWSGNVILSFPSSKTPRKPLSSFIHVPLLTLTPRAKSSVSLGVSVVTGSIVTDSSTLWSGALPLAMTVPLFHSVLPGIKWNGTLASNSAGGAVLQGLFSSLQWTGGFFLQMRLLWNATVDGLVTPGVTYISPIFFRSMIPLSGVTHTDPPSLLSASTAFPQVPIILQGTFSPDGAIFQWSGNAILSFPIVI